MPGKLHKPNAADYMGREMCMPQIVSVRYFYLMLSKNGKLVTRANQPSASDCGQGGKGVWGGENGRVAVLRTVLQIELSSPAPDFGSTGSCLTSN